MDIMRFDSDRARQLIALFQLGAPITPPSELWTIDELLQVAGAAIVAATARTLGASSNLPANHHEAQAQTLYYDLLTDAEFYAELTELVEQRHYDQHFEPQVEATLVRHGERRAVQVTKGQKP